MRKGSLVIFANLQFKDAEKLQCWLRNKTEKLRQDFVEEVIQEIGSLRSQNEEAKEAKEKVIKFFTDH